MIITRPLLTFILIFLSIQTFSQELNDSLIIYLPFDGNTLDESGHDNSIVNHGATLTVDRFDSQESAYYFNGIDDFMEITPTFDMSNICDFTISVWFKQSEWENQVGVVSTGLMDKPYIFDGHTHSSDVTSDYYRDGFIINLVQTSDSREYIDNTTVDEMGNVYAEVYADIDIINNWHHNVFVKRLDTTYHYLNGKLIEQKNNDRGCLNMQHKLFLGTFSGNNPNYNSFNYNFNGVIDDLRIYNKALDSTDIKYLYYGVCGIDKVLYDTIPVNDTIFVNEVIYDSISVTDTIFVNEVLYDTIPVSDTIFINEVIYDSISVTDTLIINVNLTDLDNSKINRITIYPNPAKDVINIDNSNYEVMSKYRVRIISIKSEIIFESLINAQKFQIDVSDFESTGLYFVQLYNDSDELIDVRKIMLE